MNDIMFVISPTENNQKIYPSIKEIDRITDLLRECGYKFDSILIEERIERSKIDKAIDELRKEIEENHLNVIEYADGEWIVKDFVYGAIERFKRNIGE